MSSRKSNQLNQTVVMIRLNDLFSAIRDYEPQSILQGVTTTK